MVVMTPDYLEESGRHVQPARPPVEQSREPALAVCRCASRSANYEVLAANALRRGLRARRARRSSPVSAIWMPLPASTSGKVEIESIEEGRDVAVILENLREARAVLTRLQGPWCRRTSSCATPSSWRSRTASIAHTGEDLSAVVEAELAALVDSVPALRASRCSASPSGDESPGAAIASRSRVRARGPPPVEAPQQGRGRRPRQLPQPRLTAQPEPEDHQRRRGARRRGQPRAPDAVGVVEARRRQ